MLGFYLFRPRGVAVLLLWFAFVSISDAGMTKGAVKREAEIEAISIPIIHFDGITLAQALDVVGSRAIELDAMLDPAKKGVRVVTLPEGVGQKRVRYQAMTITVATVLKELAKQAKLDLYTTSAGVVFCVPGSKPFPNAKAKKGELWSVLYKVPVEK